MSEPTLLIYLPVTSDVWLFPSYSENKDAAASNRKTVCELQLLPVRLQEVVPHSTHSKSNIYEMRLLVSSQNVFALNVHQKHISVASLLNRET